MLLPCGGRFGRGRGAEVRLSSRRIRRRLLRLRCRLQVLKRWKCLRRLLKMRKSRVRRLLRRRKARILMDGLMDDRRPVVVAHRGRLKRPKHRARRDANSRKRKIAARVRRAEIALARMSGKRLVAEMIGRRRMRGALLLHLRPRLRLQVTKPLM